MSFPQDAFTYPIRGNGKYMLLIGAVLSIFSDIASLAPLIGLIAQLVMFGYFCAIYFEIIQTTSTGSDEAPQFPGVSDPIEDLVKPAFTVVAVVLFALAPLFAYLFISKAEPARAIEIAMMAYFALYFPIAMLAAVNCGTIAAALPHVAIISIFRAGQLYLVVVAIMVAVYMGTSVITAKVMMLPWFAWPLVWVLGMYTMMVNGRALGLLYREREEELGWI